MQLKALITENSQDFISFVLDGAIVLEKVEGEFQTREMRSDTLFKCRYKRRKVLVLVELQVKKEQKIGDRLLAYCFEARRKYSLPIKACVIYLKHIADAPQPPHTWDFLADSKMLWFDYLSIEIADMEVEELRQKVRTGTSPLLLLSKGGAKRETLDQIIRQFEITQKAESLNVTRLIAGLIFTNQADQEWIERRFAAMRDFLWENSWTYRQSVEEGIEKGIEQGVRKGIEQGVRKGIEQGVRKGIEQGVRKDIEALVLMRFPSLVELVKERIEDIHDEEALRKVLITMYSAETAENAQSYLLALKRKQ